MWVKFVYLNINHNIIPIINNNSNIIKYVRLAKLNVKIIELMSIEFETLGTGIQVVKILIIIVKILLMEFYFYIPL